MKIKKPIALALTVVIAALSLAACGGVPKNSGVSEERIPNPFVEYQTLEATEQQAAFTITLPPPIVRSNSLVYQFAQELGLMEVDFENANGSGTIRKAKGNGDISGDYTEYEAQTTTVLGTIPVTLKGDGAGYTLAIWTDGAFAHSLSVDTGMSKDEWASLLQEAL